MNRLLILAHAPLASALLKVAQHVYPDCASGLDAVDVEAADTPERLDEMVRQRLDRLDAEDGLLILVDSFGASPANAATRAADGQRVRVVTGVNVPMLWRVLCYRQEPLDGLVERAVAGGVQGVMPVSAPRRQYQSTAPAQAAHDQVQHQHQQ